MAEAPSTPEPIQRLIEAFHRLPGIGPKSAQRLAYHILRTSEQEALALTEAVTDVKRRIRLCSVCLNITEADPCAYCSDDRRDKAVVCVVEQPLDVLAIERSGGYKGQYHVLHGILNPIDGVGPEDIHVRELVVRLQAGEIQEVIMATNPTVEGDGTALHISNLLAEYPIQITRLARGITAGSVLEFANKEILADALSGRQKL